MDVLHNLAFGFSVALSASNLLYCFIGVSLGTFIGVLPGIGPLVTIALLLPLTFGLTPEASIFMLAGIYYGAAYGGSTTAILANIPGESSSVMTCVDGYQLARQGRAGPALAIAALSSFAAGCFGTFLIAAFGPPLTQVAIDFGPAEYFSLILMALFLTAGLGRGSILKGVGMALSGVLLGLIGADITSGARRFTFGLPELYDGIDFAVVAMGLFAIADILVNLEHPEEKEVFVGKISGLVPTRRDLREAAWPTVRGTLIGSFMGILPGAGQTISSFIAYMAEARLGKDRARLGTGVIAGVAAPESANNAAAQTSFIPTLTLGIPGSATMALVLGALMIQGISPGPRILTDQPALFWGLIASMWIGNLMLVILNLPLVGLWVTFLKVPYRWLYPAILMFSCIGVYSVNRSTFDVVITGLFGLLGYLFVKMECEPAPFILGFVLGPMIEDNFRRSMLMSRGDPTTFINHPISAAFLAVTVIALIVMIVPSVRREKERAIEESG